LNFLFTVSLQTSIPISIVLAFNEDGTFGAHGIFPTLLEIWSRTFVKIEANPFLDRVDTRVTCVALGFYEVIDNCFITLYCDFIDWGSMNQFKSY
jgi:hypothetical protein